MALGNRPVEKDGGRSLATITAVAFLISLAFPIGAAVATKVTQVPRAWGVLDVAVAFVVAVLALVVAARFERRVDDDVRRVAYRAYRALINVVLVVLVLFLVAGDRIRWNVLLPGIAWRGWLLFYGLPPWLAAWRERGFVSPANPHS